MFHHYLPYRVDGEARHAGAGERQVDVLALSLRSTSAAELEEILDAWFSGGSSQDPDDVENIAHVQEIEHPR